MNLLHRLSATRAAGRMPIDLFPQIADGDHGPKASAHERHSPQAQVLAHQGLDSRDDAESRRQRADAERCCSVAFGHVAAPGVAGAHLTAGHSR